MHCWIVLNYVRILYDFMRLICKIIWLLGSFVIWKMDLLGWKLLCWLCFCDVRTKGEIGISLQILSRNRFLKFRWNYKYSAHNVEPCRIIICNLCPPPMLKLALFLKVNISTGFCYQLYLWQTENSMGRIWCEPYNPHESRVFTIFWMLLKMLV